MRTPRVAQAERLLGRLMLNAVLPLAVAYVVVTFLADPAHINTSDLVQNTNDWVKLGDAMSADFMTRIHSVTGISGVDLFCGSGNGGGWKDPAKPGQGEFTCLNVHTVIDKVEETDVNLRNARSASSANALQQQVNEQRVAQAKTLYGENWGYFLGVQDTIDKCKQGGQQVCVINFGNGNVSVPVGGNR